MQDALKIPAVMSVAHCLSAQVNLAVMQEAFPPHTHTLPHFVS